MQCKHCAESFISLIGLIRHARIHKDNVYLRRLVEEYKDTHRNFATDLINDSKDDEDDSGSGFGGGATYAF